MNYLLTDATPIAKTLKGDVIVQAGVHVFQLADGVPNEWHYVAVNGHRHEWLRADRELYSRDYWVFDLRRVMPDLTSALRGISERDVPGVIAFTARRTWQRTSDLRSLAALHATGHAAWIDGCGRRAAYS